MHQCIPAPRTSVRASLLCRLSPPSALPLFGSSLPATTEDMIMDPYMEDAIMDPYPPAPRFGPFSGNSALRREVVDLDSYLRAIGGLPPLAPGAPDSPRTPDACGGFLPVYGDLTELCKGHDAAVQEQEPAVPPEESKPLPERADHPVVTKKSATWPQLCEPYDDDIEATLRAMERNTRERPSPYFLQTTQDGVMTAAVRAAIISFMDRFSRDYNLAAGTLHRAAYYLDRYLSVTPESNDGQQLCLVGATAVFLAAKYENQYTLRKLNASAVASYCGYTTETRKKMVSCMENEILTALDYNLAGPTAFTFVENFTRHYGQDAQEQLVQLAAHQLADGSLHYYGFHLYLPSVVAASAIFLARLHVLAQPWSKDLAELTGYKAIELMDCVCNMYHNLMPNPRFLLFQEHFLEDP